MAEKRELSHAGITDSIKGWAKRCGISDATIRYRLNKKKPLAEVLQGPKWPKDGGAGKTKAKARPRRQSRPVREDAAATVRRQLQRPGPIELLKHLGYDVEVLGDYPGGRTLVTIGRLQEEA